MRSTYDTPVYIGGPLDGRQAHPRGYVRWTQYRDDRGNPVSSSRGAVHNWRYRRQPCIGAARCVYVHATVWRAWRAAS